MFKFLSLERITSTDNFQPEVDGLRFLAILPVMLTHAFYVYFQNISEVNFTNIFFLKSFFINGGSGVHIFFVISGYVLGAAFYKVAANGQKNINMKKYFFRRLIRLEPPYVISLLVFFIILVYTNRGDIVELSKHLVASILYIHNLIYGTGSVINTVAWSLEVEFQFYILAPFLYLIYMKKRLSFTIFIGLILFFLITNQLMGEMYRTLLSQGHFFILGALLHLTTNYTKLWVNKLPTLLAVIMFGATLFLFFSFKTINPDFFVNLCKLFILFIIFSFVLGGGIITRIFTIRFIYLIGGICYSIYLLHYPLLSFISKLAANYSFFHGVFGFLTFVFFALCIALLISIIFAVFLERPFMDYKGFSEYFYLKKKKVMLFVTRVNSN